MMDRALKERIIGAIVLVVLAILLVPVFLDGPSHDEDTIHESITLPGQEEQGSKQKTIVLERDREQPVPTVRQQSQPSEPPAATTQRDPESSTPTPVTQEATQSVSATGMWAVQMGSFSSQDNAERLAASLRKEGYAAFLSQLQSGSKSLHRVRVGPQKDRASAESIAAKLQAAGHDGQVVPHP